MWVMKASCGRRGLNRKQQAVERGSEGGSGVSGSSASSASARRSARSELWGCFSLCSVRSC